MKIAIINTSYSRGGAAIVTARLAEALRAAGHDARMITYSREPGLPEYAAAVSKVSSLYTKFIPERARIFAANGFNRADVFKVSTADTGLHLHKHEWVRNADVVMLNWINQGTLSLNGIRKIARSGKPIIWTMHDSWCFTGACHHPENDCTRYREQCGNCPYFHNGINAHDMSWRTWRRKQELYNDIDIHFVAVSNWLANNARNSSLLADKPVTVIPNAFPVESFSPYPSDDITLPSGVDTERKLILMGAARLDDPIKGIDYAIKALNHLAETDPELTAKSQAVFFGNLRDPHKLDKLKFPHIHLGMMKSGAALAQLYASATAVLSTSLYESLPTTLIEGQAAGCLPVTFGQGGQADIVTHMTDGYIARYLAPEDIATGLKWALTANIDRKALHAGVESRFASNVIADKYISLCESLLKGN